MKCNAILVLFVTILSLNSYGQNREHILDSSDSKYEAFNFYETNDPTKYMLTNGLSVLIGLGFSNRITNRSLRNVRSGYYENAAAIDGTKSELKRLQEGLLTSEVERNDRLAEIDEKIKHSKMELQKEMLKDPKSFSTELVEKRVKNLEKEKIDIKNRNLVTVEFKETELAKTKNDIRSLESLEGPKSRKVMKWKVIKFISSLANIYFLSDIAAKAYIAYGTDYSFDDLPGETAYRLILEVLPIDDKEEVEKVASEIESYSEEVIQEAIEDLKSIKKDGDSYHHEGNKFLDRIYGENSDSMN